MMTDHNRPEHKDAQPPSVPPREVNAEIVDDESSAGPFGRGSDIAGNVHQKTVHMEVRSGGCGCCGCLSGCLLVFILLLLLLVPGSCAMLSVF